MKTKTLLSWVAVIALAVAVVVAVCLSRLPPSSGIPLGVAYTPYYQGDSGPGTAISVEQIDRDIEAILPYFPAVRGYGSANNLSLFYERAHAAGLDTYATAWLSGDSQEDEAELALLEDQIRKGNVTYAIVGSETLHSGALTAQELMVHIKRVQAVADEHDGKDKVVVTTADTVDALVANRETLSPLERIACHIHPVWAGMTPKQSLVFVQAEYARVEKAFGVPVDILETGYPSPGPGDLYSQLDVALFLKELSAWSGREKVTCFVLGAWDEPWKAEESSLDFESRWGVFSRGGTAKPGNEILFDSQPVTPEREAALQVPVLLERLEVFEERVMALERENQRLAELLSQQEDGQPLQEVDEDPDEEDDPPDESHQEEISLEEDNSEEAGEELEPVISSDAVQVTRVPIYGDDGPALLEGIAHVPRGYYLKVYVQVEGIWYVKPFEDNQVTVIVNNQWSCSTNTGGMDKYATAFLIEVYSDTGEKGYQFVVERPAPQ